MTRGYDAAKAQAIGAALEKARKARGYTRSDVARAVGISVSHLYRLERGTRMAPVVLLSKLAEVLGVEIECLLTNVNQTTKDDTKQPSVTQLPPDAQELCQRDEIRLWLAVVSEAIEQGLQPEDIKKAITLLKTIRRLWNKGSEQ